MQIALVAGELSGDALGAALIPALRQHYPQAQFYGIGGPQMQAAGLASLEPLETLSVMGLVEVLRHLPALLRLRRTLLKRFLADRPAVFIGIDAPDFNLRLERPLKQAGIPTVHYVSPSVWAWRQGRVRGIAEAVDLMLTLYPFEADFYRNHAVPVQCVGHPLADQIPLHNDRHAAQHALGLDPARCWLALLPGSRMQEVSRLGPLFLATARRLAAQRPQLGFLLPAATPRLRKLLTELIQVHAPDLPVVLLDGQAHTAMTAAELVLIASGTATLEALLLKRPMVVAYQLAPLTYAIAARLVKIPYVSQPNLLAGRELVPEFIQDRASVDHLATALLALLDDPARCAQLAAEFTALHQQLRSDASRTAATAIADLLAKNHLQ